MEERDQIHQAIGVQIYQARAARTGAATVGEFTGKVLEIHIAVGKLNLVSRYERLAVYRPLVPVGRADVGFLPGGLDEKRVRELGRRQIDGGIDFLVPCGTTGESPTLNEAERSRIVEILVDEAGGIEQDVDDVARYDAQQREDDHRDAEQRQHHQQQVHQQPMHQQQTPQQPLMHRESAQMLIRKMRKQKPSSRWPISMQPSFGHVQILPTEP